MPAVISPNSPMAAPPQKPAVQRHDNGRRGSAGSGRYRISLTLNIPGRSKVIRALSSVRWSGDAQSSGVVVADQLAGEVDQDRREGRQPWPLRHVSKWPRSRCHGECSRISCRSSPGCGRRPLQHQRGFGIERRGPTMAKVRLDEGKWPGSSPERQGNPLFRLPGSHRGQTLLPVRPKKGKNAPKPGVSGEYR